MRVVAVATRVAAAEIRKSLRWHWSAGSMRGDNRGIEVTQATGLTDPGLPEEFEV